MAQYKVPQDVEADDKLLGPFSFRQFVYLMVTGGLIALAVGLFQLFPVLAIIPLPFILFFGVMALPLRRDQPMETYLAALVAYYLKPKTRTWRSGQRDFTITIMAPKQIQDEDRKRNITGEEATHRLSFLADIVDTEGQAIKGAAYNHASAELALEATRTMDMFEQNNGYGRAIQKEEDRRHQEMVQAMRERIVADNTMMTSNLTGKTVETGPNYGSAAVVAPMASPAAQPGVQAVTRPVVQVGAQAVTRPVVQVGAQAGVNMATTQPGTIRPVAQPTMQQNNQAHLDRVAAMKAQISQSEAELRPQPSLTYNNPATLATPSLPSDLGGTGKTATSDKSETFSNNPSIIELANNSTYSVATIEKEANRIKERDKDEIFISLH